MQTVILPFKIQTNLAQEYHRGKDRVHEIFPHQRRKFTKLFKVACPERVEAVLKVRIPIEIKND